MKSISMTRTGQQGFALIVALILLLVMTMVAVVAMRSTTLDLKMTSNTAQNRRAFQASEGVRMMIGPLLDSMTYYQGQWPEALVEGGVPDEDAAVPNLADFADFISVVDDDPDASPYRQPYSLADLADPDNDRHDTPDMQFFSDTDEDGVVDAEDIAADVWITKIGEKPDSGKILGQDTNLNYIIYQIRAVGRSAGNARVETTTDFRALLN